MRDGRIVGVGDRADAHTWRGDATEVIDLGGATGDFGLVDGHIHPMFGLNLTQGVDLSTVTSLDELTRHCAPSGLPIRRGGYVAGPEPEHLRLLRANLGTDREAVCDIPALIILFDAHSAIATPAATAPGRHHRTARLRRQDHSANGAVVDGEVLLAELFIDPVVSTDASEQTGQQAWLVVAGRNEAAAFRATADQAGRPGRDNPEQGWAQRRRRRTSALASGRPAQPAGSSLQAERQVGS